MTLNYSKTSFDKISQNNLFFPVRSRSPKLNGGQNGGTTPAINIESHQQSDPKNVLLQIADNPKRPFFIYDIGISRERTGIKKCVRSTWTTEFVLLYADNRKELEINSQLVEF